MRGEKEIRRASENRTEEMKKKQDVEKEKRQGEKRCKEMIRDKRRRGQTRKSNENR